MIDMRYKPPHLPQVNMPYQEVLEKLDDEDIEYSLQKIEPNELESSQGIVFSDEVSGIELNDNNPIWVAGGNKVIDGHHRWIKSIQDNKPILCVVIDLHDRDACRLLNKIQDINDYEKNLNIEELLSVHRSINDKNSIESDNDAIESNDNDDFLSLIEDTNIQDDDYIGNNKILFAYRKEPVKEESVVGNFFSLTPIDGYSKYEIEFDNLLDTSEIGIVYKDSQNPIDILAKTWFPHINFEKIGEEFNLTTDKLKMKAVSEKAKKLGFDGIKYNDKIIQGLK